MSGNVPYHYYPNDMQVVHAHLKGKMPTQPSNALVTGCRWTLAPTVLVHRRYYSVTLTCGEIIDFIKNALACLRQRVVALGNVGRRVDFAPIYATLFFELLLKDRTEGSVHVWKYMMTRIRIAVFLFAIHQSITSAQCLGLVSGFMLMLMYICLHTYRPT